MSKNTQTRLHNSLVRAGSGPDIGQTAKNCRSDEEGKSVSRRNTTQGSHLAAVCVWGERLSLTGGEGGHVNRPPPQVGQGGGEAGGDTA